MTSCYYHVTKANHSSFILNKYSTFKFIVLIKHIVTNMLLKQSKTLIVHFKKYSTLNLKNMLIHKIYNYICHSNKHVTKAEQIIYHTLFFKYSTFKFIELIKHIIFLF